MAGVTGHTEDWKSLPWKEFRCNVFRLQKRIYQAQCAMTRYTAQSTYDKGRCVEEPCEAKVSRTVLKQRWGPRGPRRL